MPDNSSSEFSIGLSQDSNGKWEFRKLAIVDDAKIAGGKRAITRTYRATNVKDPARLRIVEWNIWGPIGASLQSTSNGVLATDLVQNLETRWVRRLISSGAQHALTLSVFDPPAMGEAVFDEFDFDDDNYAFDSPVGGQNVVVFDEQQSFLFASRGPVVTQISLGATPAAVGSVVLEAPVLDAEFWRSYGRLAMGPSIPMQTRTGIGPSGATYADTVATAPAQTVYASAIKEGSDRAWYIDASETDGTFNYVGFTLDGFVTLADPFQVGDPSIPANGIGPFGPFTMFGAYDSLYSFTAQGQPVPLSRALHGHQSMQNGQQWADPGFGWNYAITAIGLRAVQVGSDNPVGIGERFREFTGHNGVPVAIWAERGELWVVYQTTAGELYGYRGIFSKVTRSADEQAISFGTSPFYSQTQLTGQFDLYPWFYEPSGTCLRVFSSSTPPYPMVFRADGTNMTYMVFSADGRDDLDPNYGYSDLGGVWFGSTLDADPHLMKTLRLARLYTRNMESGDSWTLGFAFDPPPTNPTTATYQNLAAVTADGYTTLYPLDGNGLPLETVTGRAIKPRLIQVASGAHASTTMPPEINGTLEVEYDERPEFCEEIDIVVNLTSKNYNSNLIMQELLALASDENPYPVPFQLPNDLPGGVSVASGGGGLRYGFVTDVKAREDIADNSIQGVTISILSYPAVSPPQANQE